MDNPIIIIGAAILIAVVAVLIGLLVGRSITQKSNVDVEKKAAEEVSKKLADAQATADKLLTEAKRNADNVKKDKELQAKEHFIQLKSKHEAEVAERNKKTVEKEAQLK